MSFLETIEGRSGEELASAVLKYLLVNSSAFRTRLIARLRPQLPSSKAPTFRDGIICQCEFPTPDDVGAGRIDLLIREESRMVFGLENKFWADFTSDQPRKYLPTLKKMVKEESACRLIILAPRARREHTRLHVEGQGIRHFCVLLDWEEVQEDLLAISTEERSDVSAVAKFLFEYVARLVLATDIDIRSAFVVGPDVVIGNDFHYDFLAKIKSCLTDAERIRPAKEWIGFHFCALEHSKRPVGVDIPKQWLGFIRPAGSSNVVLALQPNVDVCTDALPSHETIKSSWGDTLIIVPYDETLRTIDAWKQYLQQFLAGIERTLVGSGNLLNS